jgi:tRNA nucleotidyltransferase (CCA-adding enzyme)
LVLENLSATLENETDIRLMLVKIGAECTLGVIKLKILLDMANESLLTHANEIFASNPCYRISDMAVNGNDVSDIGIRGRAIGEVLSSLLILIAEGKVKNEKEELLKVAKTL